MPISMYQTSVPIFIRMLRSLDAILGKAAAFAEARKIDPVLMLNSRLYPDMFPLSRQIQIASDTAKGAAARLAGMEPPQYEDTEVNFDHLRARLQKTIAYLESFKPEQINGSEARTVTLNHHGEEVRYAGLNYLLESVLPNFFFHVTTAYDILRHYGLEIGKKDYLGVP
ncbi:MAG: DUF1993 domain-containing protein [Thiobacillaceae bacterium]